MPPVFVNTYDTREWLYVRILLADDHVLFREGMCHLLQQMGDGVDILEAGTLDVALECVRCNPDIDLALLDLNMPAMQGMMGLSLFRERYPEMPIVVVSATTETGLVQKALDAGVSGFIPKTSPTEVMLSALRLVLSGGVYAPPDLLMPKSAHKGRGRGSAGNQLTGRQEEVLHLLAKGLPNKVIADTLNLSEGTVKIHLYAIYRALNVRNRTEAVLEAQRLHLDLDAGDAPGQT